MKIIVIGCAGSGKSTLTRRLNEYLNYPVMHLDKVYHTGGNNHISRSELLDRISAFASKNDRWIIDGNYISTLEFRLGLADTVLFLNISSDICLKNIYSREKECLDSNKNRDDIASNFDVRLTDEFINSVKNFERASLPVIKTLLDRYRDKNIKIINSYDELEIFIKDFSLDECC